MEEKDVARDFFGLTVVIMASNEQESFRETLLGISANCLPADLAEIIVFLKSDDCLAAEEYHKIEKEKLISVPMRKYVQREKALPEALLEIPPLINSTHFIIMFADNATDAASLPDMIEKAKDDPLAIVCAAKWHPDSEVSGYGFIRAFGSRLVNRIVAAVLRSDGKDLFSLFQIYPRSLLRDCPSDPYLFLCEYTIRPLAEGVPYYEIPTRYCKRTEKKTNTPVKTMVKTVFVFVRTSLKLRKSVSLNSKR